MKEKIEKALIDSGLIYIDHRGDFYVGINGDTEVNDVVDSIVKDLAD